MALEDTYITVEEADTYHTGQGNAAWDSASNTEKEAAIRQATQYLEHNYNWIGEIEDASQPLGWPRVMDVDRFDNATGYDLRDNRGRILQRPFPKQVQDACAELALEALEEPLEKARTSKNDEIKRVKAGPVEVEYDEYADSRNFFPRVQSLLKSVTDGGSRFNHNVIRVQ